MAELPAGFDLRHDGAPEANQRSTFQIRILDVVEQAVIVTDLAGCIHYWNPFAEALYGWSALEVIGRNIIDVTPTPMSQAQAADLMAHLQRGEKWSGDFLVQRRDGSTFWAQVIDSPIRDEHGRLTGIVGTSVDITERKRIEAQVREHAETIATINRIGQVLSAELDVHKLVQLVTDAATELTGAQFGAFFYNTLDERGESYQLYTLSGVDPDAFAAYPMPRNTAVFGPTFRGEGVIRSANIQEDPRYGHNPPYQGMPPGHLPVTSYLAIPVISRSGEVLGGLFFGHADADVFTERAEQIVIGIAAQTAIAMDNARLYEQAQSAIRARDHFLSMAAHELKTPVTSILGYVQMLQRRIERGETDPERTTHAVQTLSEQTHRLHELVNVLFDLSRLQLGQLDLRRSIIDLAQVVQNVIDSLEPQLVKHTITYTTSVPMGSLLIEGDVLRLTQVIDNLLQNAIKYSPHGGTIEVILQRQAETVAIQVRDHGLGIPSSAVPHLFHRFYRADNVRETHISGIGMGLYVAKEIVTLHGGTIDVESVEGVGSTFTVTLPIH